MADSYSGSVTIHPWLAALSVDHVARQTVPTFAEIELLQRATPARLVVDEV